MEAVAGGDEAREDEMRTELDVICAGEVLWKVAPLGEAVKLRPGGGAVNVALALAQAGARVGLATVLADDEVSRRSIAKIAEAGVDVAGVTLAKPRGGLVVVDAVGGAIEVGGRGMDDHEPLKVPSEWTAQILVLSGLSPVVAHAAAMVREARRARRAGTLVVIDFNASLHAWAGRDARTIHMVLREVDVARCGVADLAVLGMEMAEVREVLRESAVFVVSDPTGGATATGPFGEVSCKAGGKGDAFTSAICRELLRRGDPGESVTARWHRALRGAPS